MPEITHCQKCGDGPNDLRTLWMACFYEMSELDVPFDEKIIDGVLGNKTGEQVSAVWGTKEPVFAYTDLTKRERRFYTLTVCKDCRADWMQAIETWFKAPKSIEWPTEGPVAPIRHLGTSRPMTQEEIDARKV